MLRRWVAGFLAVVMFEAGAMAQPAATTGPADGGENAADQQRYRELIQERDQIQKRMAEISAAFDDQRRKGQPFSDELAQQSRQLTIQLRMVQQKLSTYRVTPPTINPGKTALEPGQVVKEVSINALLDTLNTAYQAQMKKEQRPAPVREAADILKKLGAGEAGSGWDYLKALELIRRNRPKAAIPLLLYYMVAHEPTASWTAPQAYADTLVLLTGEDIPFSQLQGRAIGSITVGVSQIADKLLPTLDRRSIKMEDMKPDQLRRIVRLLTALAGRQAGIDRSGRAGRESVTAYDAFHTLFYGIKDSSSRSSRAEWFSEDLSPVLVPYLLELAGGPNGEGNKSATTQPVATKPARSVDDLSAPAAKPGESVATVSPGIPFQVIPLLAKLRKDRVAPQLDKLGGDATQPTAVRLVCLLGIHAAGEKIIDKDLLKIIDTETAQDLRVPAIIALQFCTNRGPAVAKAIGFLTDKDGEICAAGVWALHGMEAPEAVAPLVKLINDPAPPDNAMLPALLTLGHLATPASIQALAAYLRAGLNDPGKEKYLDRATMAFCDATGVDYLSSRGGERDPKKAAAKALEDWAAHRTPHKLLP